MQTWDISTLDVEPHRPEVLESNDEGRVIALHLPAGEQLQEHQVHERGWLLVVSGAIEIAQGDDSVSGGAGLLAAFDPNERREVTATEDARLLLLLSPWPGEGHPSQPGQRANA